MGKCEPPTVSHDLQSAETTKGRDGLIFLASRNSINEHDYLNIGNAPRPNPRYSQI